jgi:protein gp37
MATDSKIGWTDDTRNLWWGCTEAGPECDHCYARELDSMRGPLFDDGKVHWGPEKHRWIRIERAMLEIAKSERDAISQKRNRRVFINSMSDIFEDDDRLIDPRRQFLDSVEAFPHLRFLLLTKRPRRIKKEVPIDWLADRAPENVAFGTTVGTAKSMARANYLFEVESSCVFLSIEPLLESIADPLEAYMEHLTPDMRKKMWFLIGGESGSEARRFDIEWAREIAEIACKYGVPIFMKQLGSYWHDSKTGAGLSKREPRNHYTDMSDFPRELRVQDFHPAVS